MTLGEKIRYLRLRLGLSQDKLSKISNIHILSIKNYEREKSTPQPIQLIKLAKALSVNPYVFDSSLFQFKLETLGDYYSFFILLYQNKIISFEGIRDNEDKLDSNSVSITLEPSIASFISFTVNKRDYTFDELSLHLNLNENTSEFINNILIWEMLNYRYNQIHIIYYLNIQ